MLSCGSMSLPRCRRNVFTVNRPRMPCIRHPIGVRLAIALAIATFGIAGGAAGAPPAVDEYERTEIQGVRGGLVYGVVVHPATHAIYVASETMRGGFWGLAHDPNNGTWLSDDDGASWRRIGPGGRNVRVDPADPNIVYANDRYGLYATRDGGKTWRTILPAEHQIGYRGLDLAAADPRVLYAGGPGSLAVSRDAGLTWRHFRLPENEKHEPAHIQVVQVHPADPDMALFAFYGGSRGGVWRTRDGGASFEQLTTLNARAMAIAPSRPDTIYCSGGVSHDGGATWTRIDRMGLAAWCIAVHPANPDVAYYSRPGSAVFCTRDGGKTFHTIQGVLANYDGTEVEGMAIDATRDILWAGGDTIWRGENAASGRIRLVRADGGFHAISLSHIASTPAGVWACSDAQGMHFTRDGRRWVTTAMGMHGTDALHRVAPSPRDPNVVYAAHETRLFKSLDGGMTHFNIRSDWFPHCLVDPSDPDVLYVSSRSGAGDLLRSDDGGMHFQKLGSGRFLAVHPGRGGTVWVERTGDGASDPSPGLYVSSDKGVTFSRVSDRTALGEFVVSPTNPRQLFSARYAIEKNTHVEPGVFRSDDGGATWTTLPARTDGMARMTFAGDGTLWLSSRATGLVRSVDDGRSWSPVWDTFGDIAADPWDDHSLYTITRGAIWWVHPRSVVRPEAQGPPVDRDTAPRVVPAHEALYVDRSNTTFRFTADVALLGNSQSLVLMERGLKNLVFDGQGHTVRLTGAPAVFGDDAENVTIRNFRFILGVEQERAAGEKRTARHPGTVICLTHSRHVRIEGCTFETPNACSIDTTGIQADDITITNCRLAASRRSAAVRGTGRHTIHDCTLPPGTKQAIHLEHADGSVIEGNDFGSAAINVEDSHDVRIGKNGDQGR